MMKQYREARESLEDDTLLLFRLGDFYEMFETDAERGASLLGITLTKRHEMPMAGIPFHAAEGYLTKLLNHGHKVAICDQLETAQTGKLVKRGITRILTPGTVLETDNSTQVPIISIGCHCGKEETASDDFPPVSSNSVYLPNPMISCQRSVP